MTLVRYNPNRLLKNFGGEFDSFFENFFNAPVFKGNTDCDFMPRVDIVENKEAIDLHFELPGMEKDQIKVMVEDGVLTVSGERRQESEEKDKNYIRTERSYGSFSRSFTLSENVDHEHIQAEYKNGILNVSLKKTEKAKPKEISVAVK
nr:Hsp20/alpha crystallin family protein [candidate division Zixibacteria bacterium]